MELRVLRYFLMVAREENITNAAEVLHITQPTLSRQIAQLEEELGVELFIRGKRKITLTDDGMLFRRRAQEIIELVDKTESEFVGQDEELSGEIAIGSGEASVTRILPKLIREFSQRYPKVRYNLLTGNAEDIKEKIDKGLVDVGLLLEPVDVERYEFVRMNQQERWGVLMPSNVPLARKEYIVPDDLLGLPVYMTRRSLVQKEISSWFEGKYEQLNIFATHNLIGNTARLIEEGLGYAITIEGAVDIYQNDNLCFRPFYPELLTGTVMVWKKFQTCSTLTCKFLELAKKMIKEGF
ncbi:LysR family transcriptional regulator [Bariatricus sp. SGI.154]|uniref:LysR family transcriptional regulator n=1 Tax=Bariatricus sp. SGI.154 TaxID=3420549 RepID=UPI003D070E97